MKYLIKLLLALFLAALSGCTSHIDNAPDPAESLVIICTHDRDSYPYGAIHSFNFADRAIVQRCTTKDDEPFWEIIATL